MKHTLLRCLVAFLFVASPTFLLGCGSGTKSDNTTTLPATDAGAAHGWYYTKVNVGDIQCIQVSNQFTNDTGISCNWPPPTTTTNPF